jgi:protein TonB
MAQGFTMKGFIIAVTLHIGLIAAYMLFVYINDSKAKDIPKNPNVPIYFVDIDSPPPVEDNNIPPVKQDDPVALVKDLSALQPEPVRKDIADDIVLKTQDQLNEITTGVSRTGDSVIFTDNINIRIDDNVINDKIDIVKDPVTDIFTISEVDIVPEAINLSQVKASMDYPVLAVESQIQGRVTVKVLVGPDGSVLKTGSLSGPEVFYEEVKDKVKNLQFTPGLQSNKPVKVWVTVPFNFKLQ